MYIIVNNLFHFVLFIRQSALCTHIVWPNHSGFLGFFKKFHKITCIVLKLYTFPKCSKGLDCSCKYHRHIQCQSYLPWNTYSSWSPSFTGWFLKFLRRRNVTEQKLSSQSTDYIVKILTKKFDTQLFPHVGLYLSQSMPYWTRDSFLFFQKLNSQNIFSICDSYIQNCCPDGMGQTFLFAFLGCCWYIDVCLANTPWISFKTTFK